MGSSLGAPIYPNRMDSPLALRVKVTNLRKITELPYLTERFGPSSKLIWITESGSLMLDKDMITYGHGKTCFKERANSLNNEIEELVKVNWEDQSLEIMTNYDDNSSNLSDKCWYIVEDGPRGKGHALNVGDVLSFGRVRFRVKSLDSDMSENIRSLIQSRKFNGINTKKDHVDNSPGSKSNSGKLTADSSPPSSTDLSDEEPGIEEVVCRICLDGTSNEENPIVNLCKCSGSIKNVHVECLKHWYTDRIVSKSSHCLLSYYWEKLKCELCKEDIANEVIVNEKSYSLIDIPSVRQPHIVFECFMKDSSNGLHIVKFDKMKRAITIGRGSQNDVNINDASVSREQAIITYRDGMFYLQSNSPKKSTCVQVQKRKIPFSILHGVKIKLKGFLLEVNTTEYSMKQIKVHRSSSSYSSDLAINAYYSLR